MSYFSYLGNTINNAIENVGNIVAPIEDDDEDVDRVAHDISFESGDSVQRGGAPIDDSLSDGRPEEDTHLSQEYNELLREHMAGEKVRAQQGEEIDFLKMKIQSLSIELSDQSEKYNKLKPRVSELETMMYQLRAQNTELSTLLDRAKSDLDECNAQLKGANHEVAKCRAANVQLRIAVNSAIPADSSNDTSQAAEIMHLKSQLDDTRKKSEVREVLFARVLGSISAELSRASQRMCSSSGQLEADQHSSTTASWGIMGTEVDSILDTACINEIKSAEESTRKIIALSREEADGWLLVSTATAELRKMLEINNVEAELLLDRDSKYVSIQNLVNRAADVLAAHASYKQNMLQKLKDQEEAARKIELDLRMSLNSLESDLASYKQKLEKVSADHKLCLSSSEIAAMHEELVGLQTAISRQKQSPENSGLHVDVEELIEAKKEIKRLSHEQQQLNQIILQLRRVRKAAADDHADGESIQTKADEELRADNEALCASLSEKSKEYDDLSKEFDRASELSESYCSELGHTKKAMVELKEREQSLLTELQQLTAIISSKDTQIGELVQKCDQLEHSALSFQRDPIIAPHDSTHLIEWQSRVRELEHELMVTKEKLATHAARSVATGSGELKDAQAQIQKMEHEQKQLHQIIAQLRQARKTTREDHDGALVDRETLRKENDFLNAENSNLKLTLSEKSQQLEHLGRRFQDLSLSYQSVSGELSRGDVENKELFRRLESSEQRSNTLGKELFDAECRIESLLADLALARQDLAFRETELFNLRTAIDGLSREADKRVLDAAKETETKLSLLEIKHEEVLAKCEEKNMQIVYALERQLAESKQRETDELLLRRKAEMEAASDRKRLQAAVEQAMMRLQNSTEDVVDRAVVANLFVSYFKKNRSKEILDLISRMLQFTDEQRVAVGLMVSPNPQNPVGIISSFFGSILKPPNIDEEPKLPEGDSLAEMWVNFLLEESDSHPSKIAETKSSNPTRAIMRGISYSDDEEPSSRLRGDSLSTVSISSDNSPSAGLHKNKRLLSPSSPSSKNSSNNNSNYSSSFVLSPPPSPSVS